MEPHDEILERIGGLDSKLEALNSKVAEQNARVYKNEKGIAAILISAKACLAGIVGTAAFLEWVLPWLQVASTVLGGP